MCKHNIPVCYELARTGIPWEKYGYFSENYLKTEMRTGGGLSNPSALYWSLFSRQE